MSAFNISYFLRPAHFPIFTIMAYFLGAFFIVLFVGWIMGKKTFNEEITNDGKLKLSVKSVIFFIIRYLAPLAIAVIFIKGFF